jgi:hypothetical protein
MHTLTIKTKYTFDDRVRFDSKLQGVAGTGRVFAITIDYSGQIDYIIEMETGEGYCGLQPGILEEEITMLAQSNFEKDCCKRIVGENLSRKPEKIDLTEVAWLEAVSPNILLAYFRPWERFRRQFRLYVCAYYRQHWKMLNQACRDLVALCENLAYFTQTKTEFDEGKNEVLKQAQKEWEKSGNHGLAHIGPELLDQLELKHLPGWEGWPPREIKWLEGTNQERRAALEKEFAELGRFQVMLLRDIFGNPFRPLIPDASWFTPDVLTKTQEALNDRFLPEGILNVHRLGLVADALEETGCKNFELLGHLRSKGPHVLGCWALDLILRNGEGTKERK